MNQSERLIIKKMKFSKKKFHFALFLKMIAFLACLVMFIVLMLDIWEKFTSEFTTIGIRFEKHYWFSVCWLCFWLWHHFYDLNKRVHNMSPMKKYIRIFFSKYFRDFSMSYFTSMVMKNMNCIFNTLCKAGLTIRQAR